MQTLFTTLWGYHIVFHSSHSAYSGPLDLYGVSATRWLSHIRFFWVSVLLLYCNLFIYSELVKHWHNLHMLYFILHHSIYLSVTNRITTHHCKYITHVVMLQPATPTSLSNLYEQPLTPNSSLTRLRPNPRTEKKGRKTMGLLGSGVIKACSLSCRSSLGLVGRGDSKFDPEAHQPWRTV